MSSARPSPIDATGTDAPALPRMIAWPITCVPTLFALRDIAPQYTMIFVGLAVMATVIAFTRAFAGRPHSFTLSWQLGAVYYSLFAMAVLAIIYGVLGADTILGLSVMYVSAGLCGLACVMSSKDAGPIVGVAVNSLALLVVASTALWLLGLESQAETGFAGASGTTLGAYGFDVVRVKFPLTFGYTSHASICGLVAVGLAPRLKGWAAWLAIACAVAGVILADGRTAMMAVLLVLFVWRFTPPAIMPHIAYILPLSAVLLLGMLLLLPDELLALISRSGDAAEIRSGNERLFVWSRVLEVIASSPERFIFGYGYFGQAASRVSDTYAIIFANWTGDLRFYSLHNAGIQLLLDGGVPAILLFFFFYRFIIIKNAKCWQVTKSPSSLSALNVVAFVLLGGATDTIGTPIQRDIFFAILLIGFAALRSPGSGLRDRLQSDDFPITRARRAPIVPGGSSGAVRSMR